MDKQICIGNDFVEPNKTMMGLELADNSVLH